VIELLILVVGLVLLWKFGRSLNAIAAGARTKAEVYSEGIIQDSVLERIESWESFKEELGDREVISHDEIMRELKVD